MPQTVPNRPMYGLTEPTVARNGRLCSSFFLLTGNGDAHGTGHAFHDRFRVNAGLLTQAGEFLEAGTEDLLDARIRIRVAASLTVEFGQVDTGPEALFKALQGTSTGAQQVAALKDHDP